MSLSQRQEMLHKGGTYPALQKCDRSLAADDALIHKEWQQQLDTSEYFSGPVG